MDVSTLLPHSRTHIAPILTQKVFGNMKRGFSGVHTPLLPTMLIIDQTGLGEGSAILAASQHTPIVDTPSTSQPPVTEQPQSSTSTTTPATSPSRITSSPSLSYQTHQSQISSPLRNINRQTGSGIIHKTPTRLSDAPLSGVNTPESAEGSLSQTELTDLVLKLSKKVEGLETELKNTKQIYEDFHFITPTKISASGEAHSSDISPEDQLGVLSAAKILADADKSDTVPKIVSEVQTYTRRRKDVIDVNTCSKAVNIASDFFSAAKASVNNAGDSILVKDKDPGQREGKAIMESDPAVLRYHALQNRYFSVTEVMKNICTYLKNQGGYKQSNFKGMSYEDIRPIFESVWDQNHAFVPKDSDIEKEYPAGEEKETKIDAESSKEVEEGIVAKARDDKDKRQKMQDDPEKLTLMGYVEVISDSEEIISVIPLAVKSPIVNWKSYCKGDVGYYEIHRADGSYKTYIYFSEMLNDFDREDLIILSRLFNEKYASTRPVSAADTKVTTADRKMRMEQYLQCIDYTLWEFIENGNAPIVTKTVDGKETAIPPTSVEEKE
ncbi:hypothetical protein Tco_0152926 [Tanacetum coccineum]